MQFTVPKFIEKDPKIIGPFTFKEFIYLLAGALGSIIFYIILPFHFFLIAAALLISGSLSLVYLKPNGRPLPAILKNFFAFFIGPKIYLWKKKQSFPKIIKEEKAKEEKAEEKPIFEITEKSLLKKLSREMETKLK